MSRAEIDTTQAATDTISYVATDPAGLTATSTRTVIVEPAATSPVIAPASATTTEVEATSTAQ
jgi:hypothetical protein